jgi:inner membrane protein
MLVAASNSRLMRGVLSAILLIALVLAWRVDLVAKSAAAALTAGAVLFAVLGGVLTPGKRIGVSVAGWIVVILIMATGSARIHTTTLVATRAVDPAAQVLDVVVTPLPANPICMTVITVEKEGETYRVATARVSALPSLIQAAHCGSRGGRFERSTRPSTAAIHWESEWTSPRAELLSLSRESCLARAALRFIRVPIWRPLTDSTVMLGDARYGGASGGGFSDVAMPRRTAACPHAVPPWTPPRADLLSN